jgi:hypothetical protein
MPETLMLEMAKPGKTIGQPEPHMPVQKQHRRDMQEATPLHQAGMMKLIPVRKEPGITGIH